MSEDKQGQGQAGGQDGGQQGGQGSGQPGDEGTQPQSFEEWLAGQGEDVKKLATDHVKGLKTALESERGQRKDFERQLREAAGKLEKDSQQRKELEGLATKFADLERQTAFFDGAHGAGVRNLRLAWLAAENAGLVDEKGRADFGKVKEQFPELFAATTALPPGNAGSGTQKPPSGQTMNDLIRRAAGRS